MTYVFLVKVDEMWSLGTLNGKILTVDSEDRLMKGSPVIQLHPKSTVPSEDLYAQVND